MSGPKHPTHPHLDGAAWCEPGDGTVFVGSPQIEPKVEVSGEFLQIPAIRKPKPTGVLETLRERPLETAARMYGAATQALDGARRIAVEATKGLAKAHETVEKAHANLKAAEEAMEKARDALCKLALETVK